jgi:hypothetical protein
MSTNKLPIFTFEWNYETTDENGIVTGQTTWQVKVYSIQPAEPDVGIMAAGPDDWAVFNEIGKDITDEISSKESQHIFDAACEYYNDRECE